MDYTIQAGDTPSKLAKLYTGKEGRWPEFCKANPKFPAHATYGCVFYAGNKATIPDSWVAGAPVPAPIPGPVPSPIGPPIPTPNQEVIDLDAKPGLFAGLDTTKVMAGGALIAAIVVVVYAMKKKTRSAQAA